MATKKHGGRRLKTPCRNRTKRACKRARRSCRRVTRKNKSGRKTRYCRKRRSVR
uniref:Uncharacterized protein n=1 Tax=viral metagenome TaxID=1070528 RepID=A0A6C0FGN7_9ZZZZ